ncbi:hypothetical protein DVH05_008302 [Phytophthora capsici]|nr:hypothetical protein DVH05_008302 [Phytophthora capsici]|eukprot:jgi/Phyca11/561949/estExt2_Genewise1.C_PHYCAscaffold_80288
MDSSSNSSTVDEIWTVGSLLDNNDVVGHNSIWTKLKRFLRFEKGFHNVKGGHSLSMPIDGDFSTVVSRVPRNKVKILSLISDSEYQKIHRGTYKRQAVVIKELVDEDRVDDFLVEAKMMADLDHPYIIQYVGMSWTSLADLCMLTELMEGGDLQSLLSRLSSEGHPQGMNYDKLRIANHVAQALTYLHSFQPVRLHRDVTSKEVLLTENLDAKLAGFSVSREMDDQTMTAGVGTGLWIAPEVAMGEHYNEKVDIFSFGVVLSELDTQSLPYAQARANAITDMKIVRMVAAGELQVEFSPGCLAPVVKLGKECVALDPSSRPSAPEVAYRLQMIMKDAFGQSN